MAFTSSAAAFASEGVKRARGFVRRLRGEQDVRALVRQGLRLGANVNLGPELRIDPSHCWLVSIGNDVTFAPRVHLLAHDASSTPHLGTRLGRVVIGDGVFIGAGTTVLPNVRIGDRAIVGAGSVVTRDVPSGTVAAGNPARVISTVEEFYARRRLELQRGPTWSVQEGTIPGGITEEGKRSQYDALAHGPGYLLEDDAPTGASRQELAVPHLQAQQGPDPDVFVPPPAVVIGEQAANGVAIH
jgi:maltose O-acetyltransferase